MGADAHGGGCNATLSAILAQLALLPDACRLPPLQLSHFAGKLIAAVWCGNGIAVLIHVDIFLALLVIAQGGFPGRDGGVCCVELCTAVLAAGQRGTVPLTAFGTFHDIAPLVMAFG